MGYHELATLVGIAKNRSSMAADDDPRWQHQTLPQTPRGKVSPAGAAGDAPEQAAPCVPDRFVLGEELGRGGMGCVVAATDTVLERSVAIKQALVDDADSLRRFEREAKITAQLEHPSIVPIHDAGIDASGRPYYVMRRVEGEPLADRVARTPDVKARLALVPNVLAAVDAAAFAHARDLIHRDIKPWNILIGAYGETHLIDWSSRGGSTTPTPTPTPTPMSSGTRPGHLATCHPSKPSVLDWTRARTSMRSGPRSCTC
jgi:serine/threonine protein kinase